MLDKNLQNLYLENLPHINYNKGNNSKKEFLSWCLPGATGKPLKDVGSITLIA
jgi:hypothetical protein